MSLYRYKLELEKKGFNSTDDIFLLNGKKTSVIFSNISMELSLYGISFNRKVYEPGNIQAEILVTTKVSDTTNVDVKLITKMLVNRPASLYVEEYHVAEGDKIVVDNSFKVASNYYIHEISPQFEKGTEEREVEKVDVLSGKIEKVKETIDINCIYIKLDIFSLDKLMTLNKYSQAHIGQKLFSGILESNKSSFKLQYETIRILHRGIYPEQRIPAAGKDSLAADSGTGGMHRRPDLSLSDRVNKNLPYHFPQWRMF